MLYHVQNVKQKTVSLWSMVNSNLDDYVNPFYNQYTSDKVYLPVASLRHIKLWTSYYTRWNFRYSLQVKACQHSKAIFKITTLLFNIVIK